MIDIGSVNKTWSFSTMLTLDAPSPVGARDRVTIVIPKFGLYSTFTIILTYAGIFLWMRPANERRRYIVTTSFTG